MKPLGLASISASNFVVPGAQDLLRNRVPFAGRQTHPVEVTDPDKRSFGASFGLPKEHMTKYWKLQHGTHLPQSTTLLAKPSISIFILG